MNSICKEENLKDIKEEISKKFKEGNISKDDLKSLNNDLFDVLNNNLSLEPIKVSLIDTKNEINKCQSDSSFLEDEVLIMQKDQEGYFKYFQSIIDRISGFETSINNIFFNFDLNFNTAEIFNIFDDNIDNSNTIKNIDNSNIINDNNSNKKEDYINENIYFLDSLNYKQLEHLLENLEKEIYTLDIYKKNDLKEKLKTEKRNFKKNTDACEYLIRNNEDGTTDFYFSVEDLKNLLSSYIKTIDNLTKLIIDLEEI